MVPSLVRLLRIASFVICMIVSASFLVFVVNQTKSASTHQQEALNGPPTVASTSRAPAAGTTQAGASQPTQPKPAHENGLHEALDETSSTLTSPFAGVVSASSGEWATRGVRLLLALVVYGFGLGYLARVLRVRV